MKILVGAVAFVALGSMALGLASPDGSVGESVAPVEQRPTSTPSTPTPSTSIETPRQPSGAELAPASVASTWPGRPAEAKASGDQVDWCGAITTTGDAEAVRIFGRQAVDAAACAAVGFVFDRRYSRLSLPRTTYRPDDFANILPVLDPTTARAVYRPRIASFVGNPSSNQAGEQLGLVLFTARDTGASEKHSSAGNGHVFYGPRFSGQGYRDRAAWINPTWSRVAVAIDRSSSQPRIQARLTASASMPVYATATKTDAMLTVPTQATFILRRAGDGWLINGWTISRGAVTYAPLSVG